jgi:lysylphosphatidylglycerol synthase-like protein
VAGLLAGPLLLFLAFRRLDGARLMGVLATVGPGVLLVLVPYPAGVCLDVAAWRRLLMRGRTALPFRPLLGVRLTADAVLMSLPGGSFVSEGLAPALLRRRCAVPLPEAVASMAVRKFLLGFAHGLYLLAAAGVLLAVGPAFAPRAPLSLALSLGGLVILAVALGWQRLVTQKTAARIHRLLMRLPFAWLRRRLEHTAEAFSHTDHHLTLSFAEARRLETFVPFYLGVLLLEGFETFLILRVLGVSVPLRLVLPVEAALLTVRTLAVFVPAGLGVQDAGYLAFVKLLGVADPLATSAALTVLKRSKELLWIALGYTLLLRARAGAPLTPVSEGRNAKTCSAK